MRSTTRALLVTAFLALLVAAAGCSDAGGGPDVSDAPSAAELQNRTVAAMDDVETAAFTMEMVVGSGDQELTMSGDGAMDLPNRRMRMDLTMDVGQQVQATQYVIDDTIYVNINGQWQTRDASGMNFWDQGNQLATQEEALEGATVEVTGSDVVDGNDVWELSVEPDPEKLRSLVAQQGGGADLPENVEIRDVTFRQFVDTETYHVRKFEMNATIESRGQPTSVSMSMTFDSIDEPVSIELPEEARQAADRGTS